MNKKKILITGATGFIGSHLVELYAKKGFRVTAFDRYNPIYTHGCLERSKFNNKISFIFGDIRDYDSVYKAVKGHDIVIHLAALIGIPYSYESPLAYIKTNLEGTYNILEASKNLKISKILITSTSEVYGSAKYVPMDEHHPLSPQSPYSASKIAADNLALSYYYSFNLPVTIIRPFNTFGPRQSSRAIIPTIINQILASNKPSIKLGNLNPTRDFNYVEDVCEAFYKASKTKKISGEIINIGTGLEFSIKEIALMISKLMNKKIKIKVDKIRTRPKSSEVFRLCSSNKKALKKLKWKPKYSNKKNIKIVIMKTINYFSNFENQKKNHSSKYII